jgi:hypothetical protein
MNYDEDMINDMVAEDINSEIDEMPFGEILTRLGKQELIAGKNVTFGMKEISDLREELFDKMWEARLR